MTIHTLKALKDNYIYVLSADGEAVVIDPGEAQPVLDFLEANNLKLKKILCTHHHWDHVDGVIELVKFSDCEVYCSAYDFSRVPAATHSLKDGDTLQILESEMKVIDVPGHTLGQIALWFSKEKALFAGDTLFSCGCGRLFEGTASQMFDSLKKIKALPSDTHIYFGHEYTLNNISFLYSKGIKTPELNIHKEHSEQLISQSKPTTPGRLAVELKVNPFLTAKTLEEFTEWREARNHW